MSIIGGTERIQHLPTPFYPRHGDAASLPSPLQYELLEKLVPLPCSSVSRLGVGKKRVASLCLCLSLFMHTAALAFGMLWIYDTAPQHMPAGIVMEVGLVSAPSGGTRKGDNTKAQTTQGVASATPEAAESSPSTPHNTMQQPVLPQPPPATSQKRITKKTEKPRPPTSASGESEKTLGQTSPSAGTASGSTNSTNSGAGGDTEAAPLGSTEGKSGNGKQVNPLPHYPELARQRGQEGKSILLVSIDAEGKALDVQIHTSSGYALLDKSAVNTVRRWKFTPATRRGQPVPGQVLVPVEFRLR